MNKINVLFTALTIVFVALWSCNKDPELVLINKKTDSTKEKILAFKGKIENPENAKSRETMTIDSAVWYIEALLNFEHLSNPNNEIIKTDSCFINVPVANQNLKINEIISAYNKLNANLDVFIGNQYMYLTDISVVENNIKSDDLTIKLTTVISDDKAVNSFFTFNETDYWKPMFGDGKCDIYGGQFIGKDAKTELQRKANYKITYYTPYGYITDVQIKSVGTAYGYHEYFWEGFRNDCLSPDEMNYWLERVQTLADILTPDGKQILNYEYYYDFFGDLEENTAYFYGAHFAYGIWHPIQNPNTQID